MLRGEGEIFSQEIDEQRLCRIKKTVLSKKHTQKNPRTDSIFMITNGHSLMLNTFTQVTFTDIVMHTSKGSLTLVVIQKQKKNGFLISS